MPGIDTGKGWSCVPHKRTCRSAEVWSQVCHLTSMSTKPLHTLFLDCNQNTCYPKCFAIPSTWSYSLCRFFLTFLIVWVCSCEIMWLLRSEASWFEAAHSSIFNWVAAVILTVVWKRLKIKYNTLGYCNCSCCNFMAQGGVMNGDILCCCFDSANLMSDWRNGPSNYYLYSSIHCT